MSKQINFFQAEADKTFIAEILKSVFGEVIEVPYNKGDFTPFDPNKNKTRFYLTEKDSQDTVLYRIHEFYNGSTAEIIDATKSPVLEYDTGCINIHGEYTAGRFYCRSDDKEFSKKVSRFFTKLKKEFWYVKKRGIYLSKSIDIENSLFLISNRTVKFTTEDLK